jgi:hypothetical protein
VRFVIREPKIVAASRDWGKHRTERLLPDGGDRGDCLSFQAGEETLSRTNLGELMAGAA